MSIRKRMRRSTSASIRGSSVPTVYDLLTEETRIADLWQRAGSSPTPEEKPLGRRVAHRPGRRRSRAGRRRWPRGDSPRQAAPRPQSEFDYVLIDCPPSLGILTINALAAVDDVFLPLQPHFLALARPVEAAQDDRPGERAAQRPAATGRRRALPVRVGHEAGRRSHAATSTSSSRKPARAASAWARVRLFETRIRRNIRLAESPSFGQSIFDYAAKSPGAEDYRALGGEVLPTTPAGNCSNRRPPSPTAAAAVLTSRVLLSLRERSFRSRRAR